MDANAPGADGPGLPAEGTWETVDITPVAPVAASHRAAATLAAALLVFGAVVGAGLWPVGSTAPLIESATGARPQSTAGDTPSVTSKAAVTPASIVVLMPADGEVVLGPRVAVAGHVYGTRNVPGEIRPMRLRVIIVIGRAVVGRADLDVVGGRFVGSVEVAEQSRGRTAELQVSDRRYPDQVMLDHSFVLGPAR